jgi:hypothetical protein
MTDLQLAVFIRSLEARLYVIVERFRLKREEEAQLELKRLHHDLGEYAGNLERPTA